MTDKLKTGYVHADGVVTPVGRASFVYVFGTQKPSANRKEEAYGITLLFDKDADLTLLKQAAQKAAKDKFGAKMDDPKFAKTLRNPFRDQGDFDYDGYVEGNTFIRASAKKEYPPGVTDANNNLLIEPHLLYSGAYVRAYLVPFAYENSGNKGVSFGLRHVQKIRDGEPLGGGSSRPEDAFEAVDGGGGETAAGATAGSIFD